MRDYFRLSKTLYYSLLIVFPLTLVYTVMGYFINWNTPFKLRNGADVLIRNFFKIFGHNADLVYILSLNIILITIVIANRQEFSNPIRISILTGMVIEGMFWCGALFTLLFLFGHQLLSTTVSFSGTEQFYLSVGAGIYGEIIFRFLLISVIQFSLRKLAGLNMLISMVSAVILSSTAFSWFHYIGVNGDVFTWSSFTYRFLAGCLLSMVYLSRGLGVTVYTHVYYDLLISSL